MNKTFVILALSAICSSSSANMPDSDTGQSEGVVVSTSISNKKVNCIAQDADGCIWMGTFWGLNKYNSYDYRQYFCFDDNIGLQDNQINDIHLDMNGRLWVATVNGISVHTSGDSFRRISDNMYSNRNIQKILETEDGTLYFSDGFILGKYSEEKDSVITVTHAVDSTFAMTDYFVAPENEIWAVRGDRIFRYEPDSEEEPSYLLPIWPSDVFPLPNGNVWISNGRQTIVFNTQIRSTIDLPDAVARNREISGKRISHIFPIGNKHILFHMDDGNFWLYYVSENKTVRGDDPRFPFDLPPFSNVSAIFLDSGKNIWFGSEDQGFFVARRYRDLFNSDDFAFSFIKDKTVVSIAYQEQQNILVLATLNNGLYLYDMSSGKHTNLPDTEATLVLVDGDGILWTVSKSMNKLTSWRISGNTLHEISSYPVRYPLSMAIDRHGTIWLGCPYDTIQYLEKGADEVKTIPNTASRSYTFTPGLLPKRNGEILACSFNRPVKVIGPDFKARISEISGENLENCIKRSVYIPTDIMEDSEGLIWLGTVANGLLCWNPDTKTLTPVPGAPCSDIMGILEDNGGNIWVSTMSGIGMLDKSTMKFTNYSEGDGIGGNQFTDRARCKLSDGTLVFGGNHGITIFKPKTDMDPITVPVIFEDVKVHGQPLDFDFGQNRQLRLNHRQNSFSISFAALNYSLNEKTHYYYMMEGIDSDWINAGFNREAYYSNLPAGRYTFKVKVRTLSDSLQSDEIVLPIKIIPAPWLSAWAYLLYSLAGLFLIYSAMRNHRRREKAKEEQRRTERQKQFFTNLAHEFRSPLTMISGPLSMLEKSTDIGENDRKLLQVAKKSSVWMMQLVDQFLDLDKLAENALKLSVSKNDITGVLKNLAELFRLNAKTKSINFVCKGLDEPFMMPFDKDKLIKIVVNLLSNAFKYTPMGGSIELTFDTTADKMAEMRVSDTGPGVRDALKEKIFERYFADKDKGGIGIGLYYSRLLADLHHGTLTVTDAQHENGEGGACFILRIPYDDCAYTAEEYSANNDSKPAERDMPEIPAADEKAKPAAGNPKILVVDDDEDVAHYLQLILSPYYNVTCCFDAASALTKIKEEMPELVLSDIMMPGTNGYELCKQIKSDLAMSHIPVILVTAKASVDNQIEGLESGADAYVTKPFEPKYLFAVIKSQLDRRRRLQKDLNSSLSSEPAEKEENLSLQDKAFLSRLYSIMDESLSDPEVDINKISEILKVSRTNFYYKVKSLTGETPSTFYRNYKFNKAIALMKEGKYNLSEIAFMTGFNSSSQFSTSFKKRFGVSPKEYRQDI